MSREGGARGSCRFAQKRLNTQCGAGSCARKSPITKWANALTVFKKNSLTPNVASHSSAGWCTATVGSWNTRPVGEAWTARGPRPEGDSRCWAPSCVHGASPRQSVHPLARGLGLQVSSAKPFVSPSAWFRSSAPGPSCVVGTAEETPVEWRAGREDSR